MQVVKSLNSRVLLLESNKLEELFYILKTLMSNT